MSTNQERVHALFNVARYLAVEDRKAYLDKECVDDAELREEVESLLKYVPTSAATREIGTIEIGEKDVVDHRYEADDRIGGYEIIRELGEGGFGVVYFAKQHEPVEREVAIKVLHSNRCTESFIRGFEAERQTLANMSHPGIAHFYDAGLTAHNQPFFVMEFVSGQPITEYCNEHRLSIKQRLALFADVCKAVQHAHNKGVVHRDLTPNNILVSTSEDESPRAQIIDFGIARKTDEETADVMGTLLYMSPEQATRDASVDTRSDIYTLGVVLYELLVGKPPLDAEMFKEAALQAKLKVVKEQDSPTPSTKLSGIGDSDETAAIADQRQENLVSLLKILRRELDWIPRKALQKDPERRYATASEFGEDISRYLNDEAVVAVPDSAAYRMKKLFNRNKGKFNAAATFLFVLVGGIILILHFAFDAVEQKGIANEQTKIATEETSRREAVKVELEITNEILSESKDNEREIKAQMSIVSQILKLATYSRESKDDQEEISKSVWPDINLPDIQERYKRYIEKLNDEDKIKLGKHVAAAAETLDSFYIEVPLIIASGSNVHPRVISWFLSQTVLLQESASALEVLLPVFDYSEFSNTELNILAWVFVLNRNLESAQAIFDKADLSPIEMIAPNEKFINILKEPGILLQKQEEYAAAQDEFERLIRISTFLLGEESETTIALSIPLGWTLHDQKNYIKAEAVFREWLEISKESLGEKNESSMILGEGLGRSFYLQKNYAKAEEIFREWLEISKESRGEDKLETIRLVSWLENSLNKQQKYIEAEAVNR